MPIEYDIEATYKGKTRSMKNYNAACYAYISGDLAEMMEDFYDDFGGTRPKLDQLDRLVFIRRLDQSAYVENVCPIATEQYLTAFVALHSNMITSKQYWLERDDTGTLIAVHYNLKRLNFSTLVYIDSIWRMWRDKCEWLPDWTSLYEEGYDPHFALAWTMCCHRSKKGIDEWSFDNSQGHMPVDGAFISAKGIRNLQAGKVNKTIKGHSYCWIDRRNKKAKAYRGLIPKEWRENSGKISYTGRNALIGSSSTSEGNIMEDLTSKYGVPVTGGNDGYSWESGKIVRVKDFASYLDGSGEFNVYRSDMK